MFSLSKTLHAGLLALASGTTPVPDAIDRTAPVVIETVVDIAAPPEAVWRVLVDVDRWPRWNTLIASAMLNGPLSPGSVIHWHTTEKAGSLEIRSRLTRTDPASALDWAGLGGETLGLHSWRLVATSGGTRVYNTESFRGGLADTDTAALQSVGETVLLQWNASLKQEVEHGTGS